MPVSMPRTMFDKMWNAHFVARRLDGREMIYVDRHVLHDLHAPHAFEKLENSGRGVRRADLTWSVQDHTVATKPGRNETTNPDGAQFQRAMREGISRQGHALYPAFPYTAFAQISDEDMIALYAHLMAQPAVASRPPTTLGTCVSPSKMWFVREWWTACERCQLK